MCYNYLRWVTKFPQNGDSRKEMIKMMENLFNNENGNGIKIDDLLEFARKLSEQNSEDSDIERDEFLEKIIKEEEKVKQQSRDYKMNKITEIIDGVSRKYAVREFGVDREDLRQDLWVATLELIDKCGGIDNTDIPLIAKNCWNKAVDKYRYNRRRMDSKALYDEAVDGEKESATETKIHKSKFQSGMDAVLIKEAIDLFPKGSRERKYVITKLYMYGEIDIDSIDSDEDFEIPDGDTESDILKLLGYNSHYPASWGGRKFNMKKVIYQYLGRLDGYNENMSSEERIEFIRRRIEQLLFMEMNTYYIGLNQLMKDDILKMVGARKEEVQKAIKISKRVLSCLDHRNNSVYIIKNEKKWVDHILGLGDILL